MKHYNLYYKDTRINNRPLTEPELINIMSQKELYKQQKYSNDMMKISTKDVKVVKCVLL